MKMTENEIKENLCYYDLRNPDGINMYNFLDDDEKSNYGNYARKNCNCDNCFYGRTKLAQELLKYIEK
jgi:hypothetical protein